MISLDPRDGSSSDATRQFSVFAAKVLPPWGIKVRIRCLESGDAAWTGYGPEDKLVRVGIERKTVGDLMGSWRSGRLIDQVGAMVEQYPERYLVIEGPMRSDPTTGTLQIALGSLTGDNPVFGGRWVNQGYGARGLWSDLHGYLQTIRRQGQVIVIPTLTMLETTLLIATLYRWYAKAWGEHKSLLPVLKRINGQQIDNGQIGVLRHMSVLRKMYAQIPSIGWVRSAAVEREFPTLRAALDAPLAAWLRIDGFGKVIAAKAIAELHGTPNRERHYARKADML